MFSSKSDIYRGEWLELVFANRNKGYGAYELRQTYNQTLSKALLISCSLVVVFFAGIAVSNRTVIVDDIPGSIPPADTFIVKMHEKPNFPATKPEKVISTPENISSSAAKTNISTKRFVTMTPVSSSLIIEDPVPIDELKNVTVGVQNIDGTESGDNLLRSSSAGTGLGAETETGSDVFETVEKLPMFPGGVEAFSKFLSRNLQYPEGAADENVSGKVLVSFIVEKDGTLTDFEILRKVGFGCDEEAIRVLTKAPHWIPGEQNGKKVRVRYTIPIVFRLAE